MYISEPCHHVHLFIVSLTDCGKSYSKHISFQHVSEFALIHLFVYQSIYQMLYVMRERETSPESWNSSDYSDYSCPVEFDCWFFWNSGNKKHVH